MEKSCWAFGSCFVSSCLSSDVSLESPSLATLSRTEVLFPIQVVSKPLSMLVFLSSSCLCIWLRLSPLLQHEFPECTDPVSFSSCTPLPRACLANSRCSVNVSHEGLQVSLRFAEGASWGELDEPVRGSPSVG